MDSPVPDSKDTNHRSLKSKILSLYGGDTWSEILSLESFRVRITRRAADLHFLKNCRDNNLIPPFAQVKHRLQNRYNSKAFFQLSFSLIRSEIRRARASLENLGRLALSTHLKLANSIDKNLWAIIDARTALKADNEGQIAQARQRKKLSKLFNASHEKVENLKPAIESAQSVCAVDRKQSKLNNIIMKNDNGTGMSSCDYNPKNVNLSNNSIKEYTANNNELPVSDQNSMKYIKECAGNVILERLHVLDLNSMIGNVVISQNIGKIDNGISLSYCENLKDVCII